MHSLLIFLTSYLVVFFSIPPIIKVAYQKRLFDDPSELRKVHKRIIPNLGGIALFTAFLFSASLFIPYGLLPQGNLLMSAGLVLFMTGLRDDIVGLTPAVKFLAQIFSAVIVAVVADIRIENLHGLFDYQQLNYTSSITLTVLFIVGIINAFNLIDGIDGLAGTITMICCFTYGFIFYKAGEMGWFYLTLALSGGTLGFLFFNITPAKIFMGDSGSLVIGFLAAIFSIKFLSLELSAPIQLGPFPLRYGTGVVLAILIIPIFDTLRVFTLRIIKNKSPFTADANHLHHRLLFLGLSHIQATFILALTNIIFILMVLSIQKLTSGQIVGITVVAILTVNGCLSLYIEQYKKMLFSNPKAGTVKRVTKPISKHYGADVLNKIFKN